jgi:hypothetical protein
MRDFPDLNWADTRLAGLSQRIKNDINAELRDTTERLRTFLTGKLSPAEIEDLCGYMQEKDGAA